MQPQLMVPPSTHARTHSYANSSLPSGRPQLRTPLNQVLISADLLEGELQAAQDSEDTPRAAAAPATPARRMYAGKRLRSPSVTLNDLDLVRTNSCGSLPSLEVRQCRVYLHTLKSSAQHLLDGVCGHARTIIML